MFHPASKPATLSIVRLLATFALSCLCLNVGAAVMKYDAAGNGRTVVNYPSLLDQRDLGLQARFSKLFKRPDLARAVREQRLSAALVDITYIDQPKMAQINGNTMLYAASLPKIAILLGAYEKAADQGARIDESTHESLVAMIRYSSNRAATEMYESVGPAYLADVLQSKRYRLYDNRENGGLWVGRPYAKQSTWKRDPLHNISHGANAMQVARFYYLLETGQLVSEQASKSMKNILSEPGIRHKFVKGLADKPNARIFRKSGSWRSYHSDGGIIEHNGRRYIAVVIANDSNGGAWIEDLIGKFDQLITGDQPQLLAKSKTANGRSG